METSVTQAETSLEPPSFESFEQMRLADTDERSPAIDEPGSSKGENTDTASVSIDTATQNNRENDGLTSTRDHANMKEGDSASVSSTDDEEEDNESSDVDFSPSEDPELILIKANTLKEEGNSFFKEKEFEKASRSYRRGTNVLKPLNKGNTGDQQVKALLVSLQTNLSMMCFKLGKHKQSAQVASAALEVDASNVKALYRRAVARRKLGDAEAARSDLRSALDLDPTNAPVKKELASLKKELEQARQAQKKGLQKAFSKSGSGLGSLYDDMELENRRKVEEAKRKKEQEEEMLKKRKTKWEDECVKRLAKSEPVMSFDEWEEQRKKREEEEEKLKKEERRKAREAAKAKDDENDSDEELTEKELAQLRGYKKTADGRVTSYFTREQSAHEKSLIGDIAPKRLEPTCTGASSPTPASTPLPTENGKGNPSIWNQAGVTWEERNTTDWCRERLESRLKEAKSSCGDLEAIVSTVENLTGDASVAIASGKKRYIFDFHCNVKFDVRELSTEKVVSKGTLKLPDICSTHHEELEVEWTGWKKKPSNDHATNATECKSVLVAKIRENVKLFVDDFNETY